MTNRRSQTGITLVVSLIMLVILTLLVVSAVRFGHINLKIAGNAQAEAEASAAAMVALDQTLAAIDAAPKVDEIAAQPAVSVSTGGGTYTVAISKPDCILTRNIKSWELTTEPEDQVCYEGGDGEKQIGPDGKLTSQPTACKNQQWDVTASVDDAVSNAKVSMLQGVAVRVGAEVTCP
ncbi:hypothetical protein PE066_19290 [Ramlibacter tataouinensis]|uniref:pilus assembly PilX family protein n=1 Tax=Ramlibacter tataouinensis TaxID=94132 RepID=UPI0022F3AE7D|nr:PilX N-terminal domain-containing pilus assembly protein [Ramlibacter tataouinensis]WBY01580.1 hypothetical protein PE066_19290 [Ramlibacter tataouinensis]